MSHTWSTPKEIAKLSRKTIGKELALKVADYLESGGTIINNHRDYCGHGLRYEDGKFTLLQCDDYTLYLKTNPKDILEVWKSKKEFVDFFFKTIGLFYERSRF